MADEVPVLILESILRSYLAQEKFFTEAVFFFFKAADEADVWTASRLLHHHLTSTFGEMLVANVMLICGPNSVCGDWINDAAPLMVLICICLITAFSFFFHPKTHSQIYNKKHKILLKRLRLGLASGFCLW